MAYFAIVGFIFLIWILGLASLLSAIGANILANDASITGLEAFFFANLNLFVFVCFLFAFGLGAAMGGGT